MPDYATIDVSVETRAATPADAAAENAERVATVLAEKARASRARGGDQVGSPIPDLPGIVFVMTG